MASSSILDDVKRMSDHGPVLRKGPFKGKRVEFASTAGIERFEDIAEDFMLDIFGFEAGHYLITDLSSLHDFVGVDGMELVDILMRIREVYGLEVADLPSGNLLEIFRRLREQQVDSAQREGGTPSSGVSHGWQANLSSRLSPAVDGSRQTRPRGCRRGRRGARLSTGAANISSTSCAPTRRALWAPRRCPASNRWRRLPLPR
jgi:hypothetical protein